jgi:PilZ domain
MKPHKNWFQRLMSGDRRKVERHRAPGLAAYYWDGGTPRAHALGDISATGLYLLTEERWFPRTIVRMTLQKDETSEDAAESIVVEAMVVRRGEDGVGLMFLPPESHTLDGDNQRITEGADKRTLEKFLKEILSSQGWITLECALAPLTLWKRTRRAKP